ncbi:pyruvate carboxylase subunit B [Candidatus Latescibacterota bacterium]
MDNSKKDKKKNLGKIPLRITDTTLRDAHQSLWATRMKIDDIMEIIDVIDSVGYYSLEMWGGATFDVCLRFLRENPWERLRIIKSKAKKTPLQMLLRGQNILGYKNYPDDLLDRFIALACYNGIDIFRVFDALNDTRNLEFAIKSIKRHGGHAQGTLSYTVSPFHTVQTYVQAAKDQVALGIDTLCIKDMAGLLTPIAADELVRALLDEINVPVQLHCHSTSGMATATYVEGVKAGVGAIDCAISPLAGFSSQPPVETMAAIFSGTEYATELDVDALEKIEAYFRALAPKMKPDHGLISCIDPGILRHQIPGGMISNLRSQLSQQNALDKLYDVLDEVPRVRADLGYPPLVTPTSQIVGTQAVLNTLTGERYAMVPNEVKNYARGLYGRPPSKIAPEIMKKLIGDEKPITHRPADDLEPILPKATENLDSSLIEHEEDIISYCLFPETALEYLKWRKLAPEERPPAPVELELQAIVKKSGALTSESEEEKITSSESNDVSFMTPGDYIGINEIMEKAARLNINELIIRKGDASISFRGDSLKTTESESVTPHTEITAGKSEQVIPKTTAKTTASDGSDDIDLANADTIDSPLAGNFYSSSTPGKSSLVKEGDTVKAGDSVCIVEAMKLINEIKASEDCIIKKFLVKDGVTVSKGQPLLAIEKLK